jgi:hypothetical protein
MIALRAPDQSAGILAAHEGALGSGSEEASLQEDDVTRVVDAPLWGWGCNERSAQTHAAALLLRSVPFDVD